MPYNSPVTMQQNFEPGSVVLGRYVIERLLGEGGMGSVYVARHIELSRKQFAIKTLRPELFGYGEIEGRFRREAEVLAELNHPGIVSIVDYGMEKGSPVMVMEFLEGETLRDRLVRSGPLQNQELLRIVREVASALDYTHGRNPPVIHRDLKPENLFLVRPDDRIKVLDFGIAKVAGPSGNITRAHTTLGTPQYMSPEQLRDASKVDGTTDVFALASIVFECLTGTPAFPGDSLGAVVVAMFDRQRPRATALRTDLPPALDAVLARAWAMEPSERFQTAGQFATALEAALTAPMSVSTPASNAVALAPLPPTRAAVQSPVAPEAHPPTVPIATSPTLPSTTSRARKNIVSIVIGASIATTVLAGVVVFALLHNKPDRTPPSPTVTRAPLARTEPLAREPVLNTNHPQVPIEQPLPGRSGNASDTTPPAVHRDPFETVRADLEGPIQACGHGLRRATRVAMRITWSGSTGLPSNITFERNLPNQIQRCISTAVARYGRIRPQGPGFVTRQFTFTLQ